MTRLELLSPAKTADIGIEAIKHGADAVYIGAEEFGARAAAGNSIADIKRLVTFAHQYRAKVYVTVNTIIFPNERQKAERLCCRLYETGCDALIVQDLSLLSLSLPPIPLHASTQMDNRRAEQLQKLRSLGFRQGVLARELTTDEIAAIHEAVPDMALEVFVHGALCVSLSGLCNASEYLFGRSANRGECAQVCRMEFDLIDSSTSEVLVPHRHLLSLKDNCQLRNLERLIQAGATSFKIEGRLKSADYVKNITAAYSQALDSIVEQQPDKYRRAAQGMVRYSFTPDVRKSFNRGFVSDVSRPDANIYTPKSIGEPLRDFSDLHNGDGLCYIAADGSLKGLQVNNAAQLKPQKGVRYFRNKDAEWDRIMSRQSAERHIPVCINVYDNRVTMQDAEGNLVSVPLITTAAQTPQHERIRENLSRLGDSIYEAESIDIHFPDNCFIPAKQLADCRRQLTRQLDELRSQNYPRISQEHTPQTIERPEPYEETHDPDTPLMLTRYCIRRQMDMCLKEGGSRRPLALQLANGKRLFLDFDCRQCMMKVLSRISCWIMALMLLVSCLGESVTENSSATTDTIINVVDTASVQPDSILLNMSPQQIDSLVFRLSHHYSVNFNFVVKADSLMLVPREGDLTVDTCHVHEGELIAVAAVSNHIDTLWVKVAHDQQTMGWIPESELLRHASPNDPISEMLYTLSGSRGIWMSVFVAIGLAAFFIRRGKNKKLKLVRLDQMHSPYPILFLAIIAVMAGLYASIQNFVPEYWQEYYFHPSMNPLVLPPIMALLVVLVWLLIITFLAVCDEVYHNFDVIDGATYIFELLGVGMIVYLVMSWTTLIYIGYLIIPAFVHLLYLTHKKLTHTKDNEH